MPREPKRQRHRNAAPDRLTPFDPLTTAAASQFIAAAAIRARMGLRSCHASRSRTRTRDRGRPIRRSLRPTDGAELA